MQAKTGIDAHAWSFLLLASCFPLFRQTRVPISSIKVEVKKTHISDGWTFSRFATHLIEQDLF